MRAILGALFTIFFLSLAFAQDVAKPMGKEEIAEEKETSSSEATEDEEAANGIDETKMLMNFLRAYEYKFEGKRDPFREWVASKDGPEKDEKKEKRKFAKGTVLQQWDLRELELIGVIWGVDKPKAMVKDPEGNVHLVRRDSKVGLNDGYIAVIREGEIVIVESFDTDNGVLYQTKVMKVKR